MFKILVTFATRAGSTEEVAKAIGQALAAQGATTDVLPVQNVANVAEYDLVVVGSAIRMGSWLPEAVEFVGAHKSQLSSKATAYFLVSGFLREDTVEMRQKVLAFLDPVRAILEPASIGLFAGKMDYSKLPWLDRTIAKAVGSYEGDWRDWQAIRTWALGLLELLTHNTTKTEAVLA
jgi:menaquinone-dependent protoporphyrinogen oxidase